MTRFPGVRGVAAIAALLLSVLGVSSSASAQVGGAALLAQGFDLRSIQAPMISAVATVATPSPTVLPSSPLPVAPLAPTTGPSTLPLSALVDANSLGELDEEANCLATAVYFESKGEPLEGQLAVAQVIINRAASGRFPASICGVVKQRAQFSFVRRGSFPSHDRNCDGWRKAQAIARIATRRLVASLPTDVLWYHANYVTPRWRQALVVVERIGQHIFYRA